MRKYVFAVCLVLVANTFKAEDLRSYLPDRVTYNSAIPKPKDIIYHEDGKQHVSHDRLVKTSPYSKIIRKASQEKEAVKRMHILL